MAARYRASMRLAYAVAVMELWELARKGCDFEFGPDTLTWSVENRTDKPMSFFIVFNPAVLAVTNGKDWAKMPAKQDWKTTSWFVGKTKLTITSGSSIKITFSRS